MKEPGRQSPLSLDAATFRSLGHRLVDQLADFLESLPERPVTHDALPSAVRAALDLEGPLPEQGTAPGPLLESTSPLAVAHQKKLHLRAAFHQLWRDGKQIVVAFEPG